MSEQLENVNSSVFSKTKSSRTASCLVRCSRPGPKLCCGEMCFRLNCQGNFNPSNVSLPSISDEITTRECTCVRAYMPVC